MLPVLRPYQQDIFHAVMDSAHGHRGLTFSVEIARQGGRNELSSRLEMMLLFSRISEPVNLVKASPTFEPQAVISMTRLKDRLDDAGLADLWSPEFSYIIRLGNARAVFLSAEEEARVVGHTAHLLLEVDEAQDVTKEKYSRDFRPMCSTTNATTVLYGTAWDDTTLLEEVKQHNLELERQDGIRRHFRYDWQEVAKYNPDYLKYVENERQRLGENHPLFLTQYCLQPIRGGDGFLSASQRAQLQGSHPRRRCPEPGKVYIAGIDLAGEAEELEEEKLISLTPRRDSTVVTIAELDYPSSSSGFPSSPRPASTRPLPSDSVYRVPLLTPYPHKSFVSSASPSRQNIDNNSSYSPNQGINYSSLSPPWERVRVRGQIRIVEHYAWTGKRHTDLYLQLVDILRNVWHCRRVVIDATGIGQPVASFLRDNLGKRIVYPFTFTTSSKSALGFNLLAAVNSGSIKMYASDGSPEYRQFWHQVEKARSYYRPSRTMNFYVDPSQGHDDFLMSLALVVEASADARPRLAWDSNPPPYDPFRLESRRC